MKIEGHFLPTQVLRDAVNQLLKLPFADVVDVLNAIGSNAKPVSIEVPDKVEEVIDDSVRLSDVTLEAL